jgi:tetratricopeptide (TPR) repeat protein
MSQIEQIEKYLEGKMSLEEKSQFEQELRTNEDLRTAFFKISALVKGIEHVGHKEILADLQRLEMSLPNAEQELMKKNTFMNAFSYRMAAAITLLVVFMGAFYMMKPGQTEPQNLLFESNFAPYMNNVSGLSRSLGEEFSNREVAFAAYDNYNFAEAARYFDMLLEQQEDAALLLYSGNAELSLGNTDKAINRLTKLFVEYEDFNNQAAWYLSLAHLKENNASEAYTFLFYLLTSENSYSLRALDLMMQMSALDLYSMGEDNTTPTSSPVPRPFPPEKAVVYDVRVDEFETPDGSEESNSLLGSLASNLKGRSVQYGSVILDNDGSIMYFVNPRSMNNLSVGTEVMVRRVGGPSGKVVIIIGTM